MCFDYALNRNTVAGILPGEPPDEDRPNIFYFGEVGDDVNKCKRLCEQERDCFRYLHSCLFLLSIDGYDDIATNSLTSSSTTTTATATVTTTLRIAFHMLFMYLISCKYNTYPGLFIM